MPINVNSQEYVQAERDYYEANNPEEQIDALKIMISYAPSHKGGEKLRKQLKTRLKKLLEKKEKDKKSRGGGKQGIKKESMQAVLLGFGNSGKSSLLEKLTNAKPTISEIKFSTVEPTIGMMSYQGTSIQLIEVPSIESEYYDKGIVNSADTILIIVNKFEEIEEILKILEKAGGKKIILFNKSDLLSENEKRKLNARLSSKKYNYLLTSSKLEEGLEELKEKLFKSFNKIRVFTKEPGKEKTKRPIILNPESTIKDVAEKILKGFSKNVRETKIWGPSSKFGGQKVGLKHKLKDLDVVEFKTR